MREMNCRNVRREVEEVAAGDLLSSSAINHLKNCPQCGTFREERLKLREMLSTLGAVEAPGDFEFRLRARLANEKRGGRQPFVMRNLSFGFRSATVATILLLIGSALLFVSLRTQPSDSLSADTTKSPSTATDNSLNNGQKESGNIATAADNLPEKGRSDVTEGKQPSPDARENTSRAGGFRRKEVASVRGDAGSSGRLRTREMGATEARVLRQTDAMAATGTTTAFPIGASFQSLKVSLDDGRGTSRTISLPSVSFGSQRVLANGSSPLLASARSAW